MIDLQATAHIPVAQESRTHAMPASRRKLPTIAVQNPLETYLRDINETSLLTADDEKRLAHAIARGDAQARDHITNKLF